jgi:hypothetical protein
LRHCARTCWRRRPNPRPDSFHVQSGGRTSRTVGGTPAIGICGF